MAWRLQSNAWRWLKDECFGGWRRSGATLAMVASVVGGVLTFSSFARAISRSWPGQLKFAVYIYITYFGSVLGLAFGVAVLRKLWSDFKRARDQAALFAVVQHRLAEVVRRHASDFMRGVALKPLADDTVLHEILASVRHYIAERCGCDDNEIRVAVKHLIAREGDVELAAVFRDPTAVDVAPRKRAMRADDSVVYASFSAGTRQVRRVVIRDVERLDIDASAGAERVNRNVTYQNYARSCGFRSVLAFPLRHPASSDEDTMAVSGILGFLSFDAPRQNAFDGLFAEVAGLEPSNEGRHLADTKDLQIFFGLADSLATLILLAYSEAEQERRLQGRNQVVAAAGSILQ